MSVGRKRSRSVSVRFSDDEYCALKSRVKNAGITLQSFVISSSLKGKIVSSEEISVFKDISLSCEEMVKQLRGMGINLNQLARKANTEGYTRDEMRLKGLSEEVFKVKNETEDIWRLLRQLIASQKVTEP